MRNVRFENQYLIDDVHTVTFSGNVCEYYYKNGAIEKFVDKNGNYFNFFDNNKGWKKIEIKRDYSIII